MRFHRYQLLYFRQLKTTINKKKKLLEVKSMTSKQYSKPLLIAVGDAIEVTLWLYSPGFIRDNRVLRRYWFRR